MGLYFPVSCGLPSNGISWIAAGVSSAYSAADGVTKIPASTRIEMLPDVSANIPLATRSNAVSIISRRAVSSSVLYKADISNLLVLCVAEQGF